MTEQNENVAKLHALMKSLPVPGSGSGQKMDLAQGAAAGAVPLPAARCAVAVREATLDDVPFIDQLQKMHSHMVGFMPKKQLEKYVTDGHVLIAETVSEPRPSGSGAGVDDPSGDEDRARNPLPDGRGSGSRGSGGRALPEKLPGGASVKARPAQEQLSAVQKAIIHRTQARELGGVPLGKKAVITSGGVRYVDRADYVPELDAPEELKAMQQAEEEAKQKKKRPRKVRGKSDPKLVKAAREFRDRFLECVNEDGCAKLPPGAYGVYDVSRQVGSEDASMARGASEGKDGARILPRSTVDDDRLLDAA